MTNPTHSRYVSAPATLEQSHQDLWRRADVLRRPPGQLEGLPADQPAGARGGRVVQAGRQAVELRQVDVGEPEQRAVARRQVRRDAPLAGRFQGILLVTKQNRACIDLFDLTMPLEEDGFILGSMGLFSALFKRCSRAQLDH